LEAFHGAENIARGAAVTFLDETRTRLWRPEHLVDGFTSEGSLVAERDWLAQLSERRVLTAEWERISGESVRALEVVRRRAAGLAGTLVLGGIAAGAWFLLRAKKARQREVELLRQQISRDLHDEIGSHLGSIRLMSEMALREEDGGESLQEIHRLAGEAAESMRGIIWLVSEGDSPGLLSLAEAIRRSAATPLKGVSWELHVDRMEEAEAATTAPLEFHRQVFLIFREAVHNIARHARASRVTIRLGWRARRFHLCIEDDGSGFDPDSVAGGYGLVNLRHRAQSLGGSLEIQSTPAKGTRITLESPLR
jgi:signal transduction histidine kinase